MSLWDFRLGKEVLSSDADHVENCRDGTIACLLGGTEQMNSYNSRYHFVSVKHSKKDAHVKIIKDIIKERGPHLFKNLELCKKCEKTLSSLNCLDGNKTSDLK